MKKHFCMLYINCKDSPWPEMRNAELYIHISFKTGNTHLKLLQEQVKINHYSLYIRFLLKKYFKRAL